MKNQRIKLHDKVITADDKNIGTVDRLIVEPTSGEVKEAVIRKGMILPEDVRVPLETMERAGKDVVRLRCTAAQIDDLPRFVEAEFTNPPESYQPPIVYPYPAIAFAWPLYYRGAIDDSAFASEQWTPPEAREILLQQDLENAVIGEGSDVMSRDGEKVGEVHSITFDPDSGRPSRLVVRSGFLFTEERELPAETIQAADDGVIYLKLDKDEFAY